MALWIISIWLHYINPCKGLDRLHSVEGSEIFKTVGRWRWQGGQPYAPAAFTPQKIFLVLFSARGWVNPKAMGVARRIMSIKNSNDTIWYFFFKRHFRTRDLPACSAVSQPNAPPRDIAASILTTKRRLYRHVRERRRIDNFFCRSVSRKLSFQQVFCIQLSKLEPLGTTTPNFQLFWWSANWVTAKVAKRVASLPKLP